MSIRPEFSKQILSGDKAYEFRRRASFSPGDRIWIHETAPTSAVVGYFEVDRVISGPPSEVWRRCRESGGIDEERFYGYFQGRDLAHAISIREVVNLPSPLPTTSMGIHVPQSYTKVTPPTQRFLEGALAS